jgi:hypothetical protein
MPATTRDLHLIYTTIMSATTRDLHLIYTTIMPATTRDLHPIYTTIMSATARAGGSIPSMNRCSRSWCKSGVNHDRGVNQV